jgi:hypothetical protein
MTEIILKGHKVAKGKAQGEALVSKSPISFLGGVNSDTGIIVEQGHELEGMSVADKILIFPIGKGSTGGSYKIYELACNNKAPRAIINLRADPVVAVGAIMGSIPMMDIPEEDPFEIIKTGDFVEVDADQGLVRVRSKSS